MEAEQAAEMKQAQFDAAAQAAADRQLHWSQKAWNAINNHTVYIGMLAPQALRSLGSPTTDNTDIYADGEHHQWCYDHEFVYIDNGIVTAVQYRP